MAIIIASTMGSVKGSAGLLPIPDTPINISAVSSAIKEVSEAGAQRQFIDVTDEFMRPLQVEDENIGAHYSAKLSKLAKLRRLINLQPKTIFFEQIPLGKRIKAK